MGLQWSTARQRENGAPPRVVVVEDESAERDDLVEFFALKGFDALGVPDGPALDTILREGNVDLVVLDLVLPGEDGVSIARRLRRESDVGILMLTCLGQSDRQVKGLASGADAYVIKGTDLNVVEATARSILRRRDQQRGPVVAEESAWCLDALAWIVTAPNGQTCELTASEKSILSSLFSANAEAVDRRTLAAALGGDDSGNAQRNVDTIIRRLRRKIEGEIHIYFPLRSVYGTGYVFTGRVSAKN